MPHLRRRHAHHAEAQGARSVIRNMARTKSKAKKQKIPHLKPKGKRGKAQVKRLGRSFKTGGFKKIAAKAGAKYHSKEEGDRVAGYIFNKMAKAHGRK